VVSNATTRPRSLYDEALEAVSAGISIVPPQENGTKAPSTNWKFFQANIATAGRIRRWYETKGATGIGAVMGAISGNAECLEPDGEHAYKLFRDTAEAMGLGDLLDRIEAGYLDQTPGGGRHLIYRCSEIAGNQKLARDEHGKALIETRGEGGYVVCAPSYGAVHASGSPYVRLSGSFATIVTITPEERNELHTLARALDQMPDESPLPPIGSTRKEGEQDRPGDIYNARMSWPDVLMQRGWTWVSRHGEEDFWRRPGKDRGVSATTNYKGSDVLKVFTSSTPFEQNRTYTRFGAYTVLEHGGDFKAATKELARQGYQAERPKASTFTVGGEKDSDNDSATKKGAESVGSKIGEKLPRLDGGDKDLARMSRDTWAAIVARNEPPMLFRTGAGPVRLDRTLAGPYVPTMVTWEILRSEAVLAADWYQMKKIDKEWRETTSRPDKDLIINMLSGRTIPLPVLDRIVASPVFAPDGALETDPGYHQASRTYYDATPGFTVPTVPTSPTVDDVAEAKRLILDELLFDFPFVVPADRAHAVAELLLVPARAMIAGATPLHVHEAPVPGTGKDLLAEVMGRVVIGQDPRTIAYTPRSDDFGKKLLATLLQAPEWITLPNVTGRVEDAALTDTISRGAFGERVLGVSQMAYVDARNVWTLTANNVELSRDLARRSIRIRLDAQVERPQDRTNFKHDDLRGWAQCNRGRLVWAGLTLIRSWIAAGRPRGEYRMGSFQDWADVMGGILDHVGIPGFLDTAKEFADDADSEALIHRAFICAWWERFSRDKVGVASLFQVATSDAVNMDLGDAGEKSQRTRLGKAIATMRDRRYVLPNGYIVTVKRLSDDHGSSTWNLHVESRGDVDEGDV
jgi:hypothetical protein